MASQYKSGHGSSSRTTPALETGEPKRMARSVIMIWVCRYSGVMPVASCGMRPAVYHDGLCSAWSAVGQAYTCRHHAWQVAPRESKHSTADKTTVCVKGIETGP